jgi:hypothetical protein
VTPGNTAPEASLTTPVIEACACCAAAGMGTRRSAKRGTKLKNRRIWSNLLS